MGTALVIGASILVSALMLAPFIYLERRNAKRTRCRCCKTPIHPGGWGLAGLGRGFCQQCITAILRKEITPYDHPKRELPERRDVP